MTKAKTVKVRIAVAVDDKGKWDAAGWNGATDKRAIGEVETWHFTGVQHVVFIEAPVPLPPPPKVVKGKVAKGAKR